MTGRSEHDDALRHSPLEQCHLEEGAVFTEFAGWRLPLRYAGEVAEHRAVRSAAGLFDISHMGQLFVVGADAAAALARAVVSDVASLASGAARYTMLCTAAGGVLDDLIVYRLSDIEYLVVANAANAAVVLDELITRADGLRAVVTDRTADRVLMSLQGPLAARALARYLDVGNVLPSRFHLIEAAVAGRPALLARTGYTGEDGFEISTDRANGEAIWQALLDNAIDPVTAAGLAARDLLRLEAGLPLYGHELDVQHSPFDVDFGRIVDLGHEFVGRSALQRIARRDSPTVLVGLLGERQRAPRQHDRVYDGGANRVGVVTSGGPSLTLGRSIAMAYVDRTVAAVGSSLVVDVRGRPERVRIVALPFVRRPKAHAAAGSPGAGSPGAGSHRPSDDS